MTSEPTPLPVILLAFANDFQSNGRHLRKLRIEQREVVNALRSAEDARLCRVVVLPNATLMEINQALLENDVTIFHFAGHANGFELLLESEKGDVAKAGAKGFAKLLAAKKTLELVFLNGCSTRIQSHTLRDLGVNSVISTSQEINDEVATNLAIRFYQSIAVGDGIEQAFTKATAIAETENNNDPRALYVGKTAQADQQDKSAIDGMPWELSFRLGAESTATWNLPHAVGNYLFGLPNPAPPTEFEPSPYRHLSRFESQHAHLYFGRGQEIRQLFNAIVNPRTAPIILYFGPSGVGKSSLLDAGLRPRLESEDLEESQRHEVRYIRRHKQTGIAGAFQAEFAKDGITTPSKQAWLEWESRTGRPLTIILDQLEEAYTTKESAGSEELTLFWETMENLYSNQSSRPRGRLILSFRKEWLHEIKDTLIQRRLWFKEVALDKMNLSGVIEAITGPAEDERLKDVYGLTIEPGLPESIATDLMTDAKSVVAPTLQILLTRMWDEAKLKNSASPQFTNELYKSLRGRGIMLRDFLREQLDEIRHRESEAFPPDLLLDLLSTHTTSIGTAQQRSTNELMSEYSHQSKMLMLLIQACVHARLLTTGVELEHPDQPNDDSTISRLSHDTLAPIVRERYDLSAFPGQRARRILEYRAPEWENGRTGSLLNATDLEIVELGKDGMRSWTDAERRLVKASQDQRKKQLFVSTALRLSAIAACLTIAGFGFVAWIYRNDAVKYAKEADFQLSTTYISALDARSPWLSANEWDALAELANHDNEFDRINVLYAASLERELAEKAINRMPQLVHLTIGLDLDQRSRALRFVNSMIIEPDLPWWKLCLIGSLARELHLDRTDKKFAGLSNRLATRLYDSIEVHQDDPHALGLLGQALVGRNHNHGNHFLWLLSDRQKRYVYDALRTVELRERDPMVIPMSLERSIEQIESYDARFVLDEIDSDDVRNYGVSERELFERNPSRTSVAKPNAHEEGVSDQDSMSPGATGESEHRFTTVLSALFHTLGYDLSKDASFLRSPISRYAETIFDAIRPRFSAPQPSEQLPNLGDLDHVPQDVVKSFDSCIFLAQQLAALKELQYSNVSRAYLILDDYRIYEKDISSMPGDSALKHYAEFFDLLDRPEILIELIRTTDDVDILVKLSDCLTRIPNRRDGKGNSSKSMSLFYEAALDDMCRRLRSLDTAKVELNESNIAGICDGLSRIIKELDTLPGRRDDRQQRYFDAANAMMRAAADRGYDPISVQFQGIIDEMDKNRLVNLYRMPWCTFEARRVIMKRLFDLPVAPFDDSPYTYLKKAPDLSGI